MSEKEDVPKMRIPFDCPRGRNDCIALANIVCGEKSFFCCGENNGDGVAVEQDIYRVCFRGEFADWMTNYDKRDITHHTSVLARAVAVVERHHGEDRDWSPWKDLEFPEKSND